MNEDRQLAELLWSARTSAQAEAILSRVSWVHTPVGRENNIGTIRMASDPGLALVERLTNGIDSLLELGVMQSANGAPRSPREAAQLLGMPRAGIQAMTDIERRELAQHLVIAMHESGEKRRPTISVTDRGMGQHPSEFGTTILSLNESNKVGKPYTMGTYGQGGSVTFGFSKFTLVMSRRHPDLLNDDQDDVVGWTIVFEQQTDPSLNILPRYVWIVKPDGAPFSLPAKHFPELAHGMRIIHIEYDIQALQGPFTTQMWQFLQGALFEPVLPFLVTGDRAADPRKADGSPDSRVITGNAARLANIGSARGDLELGAFDSHEINLGTQYGTVKASWWALVRPPGSKSKGDAVESYVSPQSAVSLTLNGQRQDAERRTWIKDKAKMPFLYKNMIVHINANGLTPLGRRELFASTRERATESQLRKDIYEHVSDLIRSDESLRALNHDERERLLQRSTAATNDRVRKRLGAFIKTKLQGEFKNSGVGAGAGVGTRSSKGLATGLGTDAPAGGKTPRSGGEASARSVDDSHLPNVPSSISFDSKRLRVARGRKGYVWVNINAKNEYLPKNDADLRIEVVGRSKNDVVLSSRSVLLGGKSRWTFLAPLDAEIGQFDLLVELMTAGGLLSASLPIEVVEAPPEPTKLKGGTENQTGPDVRWIRKANWDLDWDAKTVGKVTQDDESTIIWVNRDYDLLSRAMSSRSLSPDQLQVRADRYQYPVACGLWLQHYETSKMETPPDEKYLRGELQRLAEAVLVTMDPDVEIAGVEQED